MFRPIYEPRSRAREYCDLAINIYTGCNHGCIYCYAPRILRKTQAVFSHVEPRKRIVEGVRFQIERDGLREKKIMLCFTCDPYPAGIDTTATREIIKAIKESGNYVQILTKSGFRALRDIDLLGEGDSFGVTITGADRSVGPNASSPNDRIWSLYYAKLCGVSSWVSCEPVYKATAIWDLIRTADYIDMFRIGKLNYSPSNIDWCDFGHEVERLCIEYHREYYIKEDLRMLMSEPEVI